MLPPFVQLGQHEQQQHGCAQSILIARMSAHKSSQPN
jgi:hypothetical protein